MARVSKNKIVVIDDDDIILNWMKVVLEDMGYEVRAFDHPKKFIKDKNKVDADLVLLDLLMPDLGGEAVLKRLKKDKKFKDVPVIFVSSSINVEKVAKKHKAEGFIQKPLSIEKLERIVSQFTN